jgi:hypothetical protein
MREIVPTYTGFPNGVDAFKVAEEINGLEMRDKISLNLFEALINMRNKPACPDS